MRRHEPPEIGLGPDGSTLGYNLSFTAASLRPELARIIAEQYLVTGDWDAARGAVLATNALQARSPASAVRMERELRQRLKTLTRDQLVLLAEGTAEDRAAMAWLALLKHVAIAFDFAVDVLRPKLSAHDPVLRPSDYEDFVEARSAAHPELTALTDSSKAKVRNVLLRSLVEGGLLVPGSRRRGAVGLVQRPVLSLAAHDVIRADEPRWLAGFLAPDAELTRY